jgi:hypothetical protein
LTSESGRAPGVAPGFIYRNDLMIFSILFSTQEGFKQQPLISNPIPVAEKIHHSELTRLAVLFGSILSKHMHASDSTEISFFTNSTSNRE